MKPKSRPRCPCCYGSGSLQDYDCYMVCDGCDGTGFDLYWMGPPERLAPETEPCST